MAMEADRSNVPTGANRGFSLSQDNWGRLVLIDVAGRRHVGVEPVRGFPLTDPERWISLCDAEGREVLFIESMDELPAEVRRILVEELALREFVPRIARIVRVSGETFPADWDVETDRGPTRFTLDSEDDVRRLGPHGALISDARKMRYQIPDTRTLDEASRRVLERYL
ncbi:MAG TPA: DUF1854 domain-containing protein [Isosphaeraceae bacterium]|nr:DUF1854 domain-containing protein [Isosphaeraceae bacterium]